MDKTTFEEWISNPTYHIKMLQNLYKKCTPDQFNKYRHIKHVNLIDMIKKLTINYPRCVQIPKDHFSYREVFIYDTEVNYILKLYNMYLNMEFPDDLSKHVFSYREHVSISHIVKQFHARYNPNQTYIKIDLTNYFMSPNGDILKSFLDKYGLTIYPYYNLFQNKCYVGDALVEKQMGLLPGTPISAFLSNAFLKDFDDYMSMSCQTYFRYSDDFIASCGSDDVGDFIAEVSDKLKILRLSINENKTKIFKPGDVVTFLGCNFTEKNIELSDKRLKNIKKSIKCIAKKNKKKSLNKEERISLFLKDTYNFLYSDIVKDLSRGGLISLWFSCTTSIRSIIMIDQYIQDKCRYVYSGKTNQGALCHGINKQYLLNYGYHPLAEMYSLYKQHPLIMSFQAFKTIKSFKVIKPKNYYLNIPKITGSYDVLDLLLYKTELIDCSSWDIDYISGEIKLGSEILFDKDKSKHEFVQNDGTKCTLYIADSYESLDEALFFDLFKLTAYKNTVNSQTRTKVFNPIPYTRLPYYSYLKYPKSNVILLVAFLLFLWRIDKIEIHFKDFYNDYIIDLTENYAFIIDGKVKTAKYNNEKH